MIVSHRHRFIYFAVPKTATHAIRTALRPQLGEDDWEQQTLDGRQLLPIAPLAKIGHGHIDVAQARAHLPESIWREYRRFAVVRNPYDRFVSACAFLTRSNAQFTHDPTAWMKAAIRRQQFQGRVLVRPQFLQLSEPHDRSLAVGLIARYEELQKSIDVVFAELGMQVTALSRRNASERRSWQSYYDDELTELVTNFYADDFKFFDYRTL